MKKDRTVICNIISKMLDNPDKYGIYPTSTAYTELELYIETARMEAIGSAHANACTILDQGADPRLVDVPELLSHCRFNLPADGINVVHFDEQLKEPQPPTNKEEPTPYTSATVLQMLLSCVRDALEMAGKMASRPQYRQTTPEYIVLRGRLNEVLKRIEELIGNL